MPCTDGGQGRYEDAQRIRNLEATLCAVLTRIEARVGVQAFFRDIDWTEAGVPLEWAATWWYAHVARDRARREAERQKVERTELARAAVAKLSDEECRALGLPPAMYGPNRDGSRGEDSADDATGMR